MQMPGSNFVAAVERMSRALEQLASAPSATAVLQEVVHGAAASLGLERSAVAWLDTDGLLATQGTPGLASEAVAACGSRLLEDPELVASQWLFDQGGAGLEPEMAEVMDRLGAATLLALPVLSSGGGCVGVLLGPSPEPRGFSPEEMRRFTLYAQLAGLAIERGRLVESARTAALQARAEAEQAELLRLTSVQAVTEAFGRALTREDVGRAVLELGVPAVGAVGGTVHQLSSNGRSVELVAAVGSSLEALAPLKSLPREMPEMPGYDAAARGTPVWLESLEDARARYPAFAVYMAHKSCQAFAFLPLRVEQRGLGLLAFGFAQARHFTELQRTLMLGLARQCAQAMERARLYETERSARLQAEAAGQRLQLLADAGVLLSGSLEWETTVAGVAQLSVGTFSDWCAVDFLDEHGALRRLTVRHAQPERALMHDKIEAYAPERSRPSAITDVVRTGRAQLVVGLMPPFTRKVEGEAGQSPEGGSFIIVPLVARQRTLGAMSFVRGPERTPFTEADRSLAEDMAARAGLAIDNARLLRKARAAEAESRHNAARLRILVEVDRLLAEAGLDLPAVLDVIARKVSEVIGDGCVLQLMDEDGAFLEPVTIHHPDPEARWLLAGTVHARRQKPGEGLHGGTVTSGRAVLLPDIDEEEARVSGGLPEYLPYLDRYGPQSLLVVPLAVKGRVFGTLGVVRDVAGGRPYNEEDQLLLQSLAERAALAIEDARLYGAATEAVRLRDDFLSVAGHELKTPLSALRLQIQMLARVARDVATTPGLAQRVEKAERTSERLGALIDELLDAGRITAGRLKLEREEMDLASLTRDAVGRMSEALARAGSEVKLMADTSVVGRWDRVRLEQVVGNLLSNAAKYGRGQPVEVRVETGHDGRARLVVKDHGIGIAPEDQGRIFERFERAVNGKQFHGLGLGLWISREIVESHGGHIQVCSAPGEGSTFTVELPRE
ncbi:GAF domain-containing protein [Vitiosangium sp. GDMCC 1.1324]|uniref:sensor histidine kinase n=1 Tax=Vitiosangium sp. (strain GDMCC 1.1324) TaxID=2138576 RepID=UPI000D3B3B18|nr:GAF domain-containing protein [Vitiosangium sp. GDMCC 1.1324]PTL79626.1 histidine kinase [Vitiosangium sp. GDMCC 1.1324]